MTIYNINNSTQWESVAIGTAITSSDTVNLTSDFGFLKYKLVPTKKWK
jgi:hypothetical protein